MEYTVYIRKAALDYFRLKARDSKFEIHAYLIGEVKYPNKYIVTSIEHARSYAEQEVWTVTPSGEDWNRVNRKADDLNKRIIGDIHSHPDDDPIMSSADYQACIKDGTEICAIVSVRGRKTKVNFWHVNSALRCKVSYAEND